MRKLGLVLFALFFVFRINGQGLEVILEQNGKEKKWSVTEEREVTIGGKPIWNITSLH